MARGTATRHQTAPTPRVRRGYFECRFGQLHVHNAIPPGGGFEEGTALLCLPPAPRSGRIFRSFMALAGADRSVYAPDLPGCGESDPPPAQPTVGDYVTAIGDFLDVMRFRQIDVIGYQAGSLIAAELAIARPAQIRRVVMAGVPVLTEAEREAARRSALTVSPETDGAELIAGLRRMIESHGPGVPVESLAHALADELRCAGSSRWGALSMSSHAVRERLGLVRQPVQVLRLRDDLWDATLRVRELFPKARIVELPELGQAALEVAPQAILDAIRDFIRD